MSLVNNPISDLPFPSEMEIVPLPQGILERIIPVMQHLFRVEFRIAEPSHQSAKRPNPTNLLTFC